jgi:hypothetical protein
MNEFNEFGLPPDMGENLGASPIWLYWDLCGEFMDWTADEKQAKRWGGIVIRYDRGPVLSGLIVDYKP